jgi:sarcosine oxidase subunit gamma
MLKTPASPQADSGVLATWEADWSIVNVRGNPADPAFVDAVSQALGQAWPLAACSSSLSPELQVLWAGPDDWFVLSRRHTPEALVDTLRSALAGQHAAVTDVSSGYTRLTLSGPRVRELLAQGCPLDLHPRQFPLGQSAGSVFFKASVWLWSLDDAPTYALLVRSSFQGYVRLMLQQCTAESGCVEQGLA